ncbi:hypothetical protein [Microbacterium sp. NPDC080220]|uniref:hypothetical protein n=1 Tax=Microbacterium sp. NPDC080220 TaxID=3161017 RepID=UPI003436FD22
MSTQVLASNGVPVTLTDDGRLIVENSDHTYPATVAAGEHVDALREFFRTEEDARLGRWRWPENPDYVVYPDGTSRRVVRESDGASLNVSLHDREVMTTYLDSYVGAARAYDEFHPEPKPWHDAKPGEVWVIVTRNVGEERAVQVHGDQFHYNDGYEFPLTYDAIESGRRIWPGDAS